MKALILSILFLTGCTVLPDGSIPRSIVSWSETNVWQVVSARSAGSGFWLNNRTMLTNCHVVKGETTVTVENNDRSLVLPMTVRACDSDEDIALLIYTPDEPLPFQPQPTHISQDNPEDGQILYGPGYPVGGSMVITSGHYFGKDDRFGGRYIVSTTVFFGDSGSPAIYIDNFGRVTVAAIRSGMRGIRSGFGAFYITHLGTVKDTKAIQKFIRENA